MQRKRDGRKRETRCVLVDGKRDLFFPCYDVCVVSVGAGDSVEAASVGSVGSAAVAATAGSVGCAAVTVTEAGGAVVERGKMGATPWGRRGGSWEGSMVGRGKGARPGRLRGGREARGGTGGGKQRW